MSSTAPRTPAEHHYNLAESGLADLGRTGFDDAGRTVEVLVALTHATLAIAASFTTTTIHPEGAPSYLPRLTPRGTPCRVSVAMKKSLGKDSAGRTSCSSLLAPVLASKAAPHCAANERVNKSTRDCVTSCGFGLPQEPVSAAFRLRRRWAAYSLG
jgi:hypothetical protein